MKTAKQVLVIGGTQGIGKHTAIHFAKQGASVTITGRNKELGTQLEKEYGELTFQSMDVHQFHSINDFSKEYIQKHSHLDVLVLCAGGLNYGPRRVVDGLEMTFAQNVASRFRITRNLIPIMKNTTVVNCLGAGNGGAIDLSDLELKNGYNFIKAASQYATMNDLLAVEFAKRYGSVGQFIHFFPGVVNTESVKNQGFPWIISYLSSIALPWIATSPEKTAQIIYEMTLKTFEKRFALLGPNGKDVQQVKFISQHPEAGQIIWDYLETVTTRVS